MFKKITENKIIVKPVEKEEEKEEKTASGLIIPKTQTAEMHDMGTVVKTGPKCEEVSEGDKIMYDKMAIREIQLDDTYYVLLNEESVVGIF